MKYVPSNLSSNLLSGCPLSRSTEINLPACLSVSPGDSKFNVLFRNNASFKNLFLPNARRCSLDS